MFCVVPLTDRRSLASSSILKVCFGGGGEEWRCSLIVAPVEPLLFALALIRRYYYKVLTCHVDPARYPTDMSIAYQCQDRTLGNLLLLGQARFFFYYIQDRGQ